MPKINQEEYEVLKRLDSPWRWVARDEDGGLWVYKSKPNKLEETWQAGVFMGLNDYILEFIQWEDEEPHNIAELIEEYESEEAEVKTKQELIEEWESAIESAEFYGKGKEERLISYMKDFVSDLNQLDEPETLSQANIGLDMTLGMYNFDITRNPPPLVV